MTSTTDKNNETHMTAEQTEPSQFDKHERRAIITSLVEIANQFKSVAIVSEEARQKHPSLAEEAVTLMHEGTWGFIESLIKKYGVM